MEVALMHRPDTIDGPVANTCDMAGLAAIRDPAVQLALWRRERPAALGWIDALDWDGIADIDAVIAGPDFGTGIASLLHDAGFPHAANGRILRDEIARLAELFATLMGRDRLRMRLEVIATDACRKFHMDYVAARLLMPLSGAGTQWVEVAQGQDAAVNQLNAGEVGIFKGRLWVDEPAILHRSPPIEATGETRLLLVLDPASESEEASLQR